MSAQHLLLFDVDGVLIEDGGYYAALIATLNYFNALMGADPIVFGPPDRDQFQSRGYVNEWDLCPLCAGILIVETLARHPDLALRPAPFDDFLRQFRGASVPQLKDVAQPYLEQIDQLQGKPVERARDMLLNALEHCLARRHSRCYRRICCARCSRKLMTLITRRSRRFFRNSSSGPSCTPSRIICRRASLRPPCWRRKIVR